MTLVGHGRAQETTEAKDVSKASDIPRLIKQLDAEEFAERQDASAKLTAAAEAAIPALEKAAAGESREASMRAFEILKGHFDNGSQTVKDAAKQALERIAKADLGVASRRANEVITPPTPVAPPVQRNIRAGFAPVMPVPGFAPAPGGIRIAGARVVIAGAAGGGGIETKIQVENGVKTTEVKDKDRKVKIVEDPDKGLQLEVTETKDGKEKTEKYEAKNADELKTKHPEAHKIFEQYSAKGGVIKIDALPGFPAPIPADRLEDLKKRSEELKKKTEEMREEAQKRTEESRKRFDELRKDAEKRFEDAKKDAEKRFEEERKRLEDLRDKAKREEAK